MSRIRPSLILRASIDERECNEEIAAGIKRTYAYVAATVVSTHEPLGEEAENVMRYDVIMHKPYWNANDEEAAALWNDVMPRWLHNMFAKVSDTVTAANRMSIRNNIRQLFFEWTELRFGENVTFAFKTKEDCSLDDSYIKLVEHGRRLMCDGSLGEDIACIRVPSRKSFESQRQAIIEERLRKEEEAERAAAIAAEATETGDGVENEAVETETVKAEEA